jgi:DNA polymerase-1
LFNSEPRNVGVLLGEPSGGLVDIDLDCEEAIRAAPLLLPATPMTWGRPRAGGRSHYGYRVDSPPAKASTSFDAPDGSRLLEIRSTGGQTLVYGTYPEGDAVSGHPLGEPARIGSAELERAVRWLAAAALLARHWTEGIRHELALAFSGGLLRSGIPLEEARLLIRAVCAAASDPELADRLAALESTHQRLAVGEEVTGWPRLAELVGPAVVQRVREWLGAADDPLRGGEWPKPVPFPSEEILPKWPVGTLPPPLETYIQILCRQLGIEPTAGGLTFLGLLSGLLAHRGLEVRPDPDNASWSEPPVLWVTLIAPPGSRKTPLLQALVVPFWGIEQQLSAENLRQQQDHERELDIWASQKRGERGVKPTPPPQRRLIVSDATVEAVAALLEHNAGLIAVIDELSGLLLSWRREDRAHGRAFYLSAHTGAPTKVDRVGRGSAFLKRPLLALVGCIQPRVWQRLIICPTESGEGDDGLLQRLVPVLVELLPLQEEAKPPLTEELTTAYHRAVPELWERPIPQTLHLDGEALELWRDFEKGIERAIRDESLPEQWRSLLAKRQGLLARLAGTLTVLWGEDRISCGIIERVLRLVKVLDAHARRAWQIGAHGGTRLAQKLLEALKRHGLREFTTRDVCRRKLAGIETAAIASRALLTLRDYHWLRYDETKKAYIVYPGLFTPADRDSTHSTPLDKLDSDPTKSTEKSVLQGVTSKNIDSTTHSTLTRHDSTEQATPSSTVECCRVGVEWLSSNVEINVNSCDSRSYTRKSRPVSSLSSVSSGLQASVPSPFADPSGTAPSTAESSLNPSINWSFRTDPEAIRQLADRIREAGEPVGLDIETAGLDPDRDRVRLIQVNVLNTVYILDLWKLDNPPAALAPLWHALGSVEVIGHNLAFDLQFLIPLGFTPGKCFDTMIASQLLHAGERDSDGQPLKHTLADVVQRHLGVTLDKSLQTSDWTGELTQAQLTYAAADVRHLPALAAVLRQRLREARLEEVAEIEMQALPTVAATQAIRIDTDRWLSLARDAEAQAQRLAQQMDQLVPRSDGPPWNWNSPQQVKEAFSALGITLDSTDDTALAAVDHPLAELLRQYRMVRKRATAFGEEWLRKHAPHGSVRPRWQLLGAESGRMSCRDPNLQQIPRSAEYRACFIARPGCVLIKADYSQIELRMAARIAREERLMVAFRERRDVHTLTAATLLGKPESEVTKADRQLAKAANFGLLYGMGYRSLRKYAQAEYGVLMTEDEAQQHWETFFALYPGLRRWHIETKQMLERCRGDVIELRTLTGRRRWLPVRKRRADGSGEYLNLSEALNYPVQGTAADGLKQALGLLWQRRRECPQAVPVLFVHDEIVIEAPRETAEQAAEWLRQCMIDGMSPFLHPIPCVVELNFGTTWGS